MTDFFGYNQSAPGHSGDANNMQKEIADAGKPITREEREDLRRAWEGENRAALAAGDSEEWEIVARVLAGRMFLALPRLLDTIDALEAEAANARLWERTRHSERLLICVCGMAPGDPGWKWAAGEGYENGHVVGGADLELCGPVGLSAPEGGE